MLDFVSLEHFVIAEQPPVNLSILIDMLVLNHAH